MKTSGKSLLGNEHNIEAPVMPARRAGATPVAPEIARDTPWRFFGTILPEDRLVRVATSMRDAKGIRDVLRSAWRVSATEKYFYESFNNAAVAFREFVEPATRTVRAHDDDIAHALLLRFEATGLGRFATAWHLRMPARRRVYEPHLDRRQAARVS